MVELRSLKDIALDSCKRIPGIFHVLRKRVATETTLTVGESDLWQAIRPRIDLDYSNPNQWDDEEEDDSKLFDGNDFSDLIDIGYYMYTYDDNHDPEPLPFFVAEWHAGNSAVYSYPRRNLYIRWLRNGGYIPEDDDVATRFFDNIRMIAQQWTDFRANARLTLIGDIALIEPSLLEEILLLANLWWGKVPPYKL